MIDTHTNDQLLVAIQTSMADAPQIDLHTTSQILRQTFLTFTSNFYTFLFLSLLIFSFRTTVENGTLIVTAFIDRDPLLKALLSRLDIAGNNLQATSSLASSAAVNRRRRSVLHLTRVGALHDDYFSGDEDDGFTFFGSNRRAQINGSFVSLSINLGKSGISDFVEDNGIRVFEVVHPGVSFNVDRLALNLEGEDREENGTIIVEKGEDGDKVKVPDLQFVIKGLELGRRDTAALFVLVCFLSAAYGWVILGFLVTYSWVLGIVFITVVNDLLGRYSAFVATIFDGSRLGLKKLSGFILMRWAVRDALTQLLGLWFFGEIEDQYSFFRLFVRLKLMPFSVTSPWIKGYESQISWFLYTWLIMDFIVSFIFSVDPWVSIVDLRRGGLELVREGCYLLSTMLNQAVQIKCLESILCGSPARWFLAHIFGKLFASCFQTVAEVYFMVAWLIYYFAARHKDANFLGRDFGRRELEGFLGNLR